MYLVLLRRVYPEKKGDIDFLRSKAKLLDEKGAIREIVAEASQLILTRKSRFLEILKDRDMGLCEKIIALAKEAIRKMQSMLRNLRTPDDGVSAHIAKHFDKLVDYYDEMMADTLDKAGRTTVEDGEVQMQIRHEDTFGISYVEIDAKDIVGKNISATDSIGKKTRLFLRDRFRGVVLPVGKTKRVYIRSEGINEYTNPAKYLDESDYNGKMLAATELDNLLKASEYLSWENDDGRHPDVIRWLKYKTVFLVTDENGNKQVLKGVVKIKRIQRGDCFYDITEIENITKGNMGQAILANAAQSQGDVPSTSISQNPDLSTENAKILENSDDGQFQYRRVDAETDRQTLAKAAQSMARSERDNEIVRSYLAKLDEYRAGQKELNEISDKLEADNWGEVKLESTERYRLLERRDSLRKTLEEADATLLEMEAMSVLQNLVEKERQKAASATLEAVTTKQTAKAREEKRQAREIRVKYLARAEAERKFAGYMIHKTTAIPYTV